MAITPYQRILQQVNQILIDSCTRDHIELIIEQSETKEQTIEILTSEVWEKVQPLLTSKEFKKLADKSTAIDKVNIEIDIQEQVEAKVASVWDDMLEQRKLDEARETAHCLSDSKCITQ